MLDFQDWVRKAPWLSWTTHSGEASCHGVRHSAALPRGLSAEDLRSPANSHILEAGPPETLTTQPRCPQIPDPETQGE